MDMNFNNKLEEYYKKFVEMQERLKRSEEQRFMLEMKFNEMVQVAKEEEQTYYRKLRTQYKKFLEEDHKRQDRNERIIRNLERIEAKITMLSAKTERISMFRREYQKYLRRITNSKPEKQIPDSKLSRERSFIKEEPLKEQQQTLFRDDYSLPERPKGIIDKEKTVYEHPAVIKSLEKDRSNEEKIQILDRYLQNISSQRCRDLLNQGPQARDKLSLDTPLDKLFNDDFLSTSTNHATAVADDIMNSIYSRYYTKAEVPPKSNTVDFPADIQNNANKTNNMAAKGKTFPSFKDEEKLSQLRDNTKFDTNEIKDFGDAEKNRFSPNNARGFSNNFKSNNDPYNQDQYKEDTILANAETKQGNLKEGPDTGSKIRYDTNKYKDFQNDIGNTLTNDLKKDHGQNEYMKNQNQYENVKNESRELSGSPQKNELKDIDTNQSFISSNVVQNSDPNSVPSIEQYNQNMDKLQKKDEIKSKAHEQILKYDSNNSVSPNKDNLQEKDQSQRQHLAYDPYQTEEPYAPKEKSESKAHEQILKYDSNKLVNPNKNNLQEKDQSQGQHLEYDSFQTEEPYAPKDKSEYKAHEQILKYDSNNSVNPNKDNLQEKDQSQGQRLEYDPYQTAPTAKSEPEQFIQQSGNTQVDDQRSPVNPDNHDNLDQYNENNESRQQPSLYDQNRHDVQQVQYNPSDENAIQQAQFDETDQPAGFAENNQNYQQIQYDENGQPIPYDETGQPTGYDQYGQPFVYDQNGQVVQPRYDENGQFIPQYDESGQMIMLYDQNGQPLFNDEYKTNQQHYDVSDQPMQYDENGQPIYDPSQQQYYDYTNQEQTNPSNGYNQFQDGDQEHYIETQDGHLQDQAEDGNYYPGGDQEGSQIEGDQYQAGAGETQDVIGGDVEKKPANVMDILDTDTESTKQNVSKVSNESDFDFS